MNNTKENDEVGKEVPPAPNPVEEGTLSEVQVEAPVDQSSLPVPMEESSDPVENGHGIAVVKNSTDDNKPKTAPGPPLPEQHDSTSMEVLENQEVIKPEHEEPANAAETQYKDADLSQQETTVDSTILSASQLGPAKPVLEAKAEDSGMRESKIGGVAEGVAPDQNDAVIASDAASVEVKDENEKVEHTKVEVHQTETPVQNDAVIAPDVASVEVKDENEKVEQMKIEVHQTETPVVKDNGNSSLKHLFLLDENDEGSESGTEEEQSLFMKELENFFRERSMEFKPPKFYGEGLNCLKLWRAVTRLGGYDKVTSCKLWRQVGESFKPPKTCTTVSWTFRGFYEKALLDYERHKIRGGELNIPAASPTEPIAADNQASGSGRAPRDAAARARQGWHSQRLLGNGEVSDPIIKDKNAMSLQKREKQLKNIGLLKRKKQPYPESSLKVARPKTSKSQLDVEVVDIGPPAEWVKINVQKTKDCFEVYALVPGLLREEVRVQSDPAGRLVISGEPENPDNPWGVTPFKKVVNLPSRIDPHQTSAVVTLHGQLFVRVPFEQSE